ncbi:MAG: glycosyltransferase family 2 protein [Dehalococcoidales bacterium]
MPLVSIIMNCYNSARYLREALDSVFRQTFKDYEIIFWDNQSTDDSPKIAQSYGRPLKYFRGEAFLPLGAARNKAIEKASGKYIAFLDCDDIWLPEKLTKQVAQLEANNALGLVYSDCYLIDSAGQSSEETFFNRVHPSKGMAFNGLFQQNPIPLLTAVITREALEKVGTFNPKYEIAEEYDLWLRIAQHYPIDFIDQPLGKYRFHSQSAMSRNHLLVYKETIQIRNHWLVQNPALKKEMGGRFKALKYWPIILGAAGNILRKRTVKSIKESLELLKFMCRVYANSARE